MDAFEELIASFLRHQGYWVIPSFKVKLTKEEKVVIGRYSAPRWEVDLVAYKPQDNELLAVECKSFFDSHGVSAKSFQTGLKPDRYKLFNESVLREVVFSRLVQQLQKQGAVVGNPSVTLCLAAGRIASPEDAGALKLLFEERGWRLFDRAWILEQMKSLSTDSYQNSVASILSKVLIRDIDRAC